MPNRAEPVLAALWRSPDVDEWWRTLWPDTCVVAIALDGKQRFYRVQATEIEEPSATTEDVNEGRSRHPYGWHKEEEAEA